MGEIVVYDANATVREILRSRLNTEGFDVVMMENVADCESVLSRCRSPQALLLDVSRVPDILPHLQTVVPRYIPKAEVCVLTSIQPTALAKYLPAALSSCFFRHVIERPFKMGDFLRFFKDILPTISVTEEQKSSAPLVSAASAVVNSSVSQITGSDGVKSCAQVQEDAVLRHQIEDIIESGSCSIAVKDIRKALQRSIECQKPSPEAPSEQATSDPQQTPLSKGKATAFVPHPVGKPSEPRRSHLMHRELIASLPAAAGNNRQQQPTAQPNANNAIGRDGGNLPLRRTPDEHADKKDVLKQARGRNTAPKQTNRNTAPKQPDVAIPKTDLPTANRPPLPALSGRKHDAASQPSISPTPQPNISPTPQPALPPKCSEQKPSQTEVSSSTPSHAEVSSGIQNHTEVSSSTLNQAEVSPQSQNPVDVSSNASTHTATLTELTEFPNSSLGLTQPTDLSLSQTLELPFVSKTQLQIPTLIEAVEQSMMNHTSQTIAVEEGNIEHIMFIEAGRAFWFESLQESTFLDAAQYIEQLPATLTFDRSRLLALLAQGYPVSQGFKSLELEKLAGDLCREQITRGISLFLTHLQGCVCTIYNNIPPQWGRLVRMRPCKYIPLYPVIFDILRENEDMVMPPPLFQEAQFITRHYRTPFNRHIQLSPDEINLLSEIKQPKTLKALRQSGRKHAADILYRLYLMGFADMTQSLSPND